MHVEGKLIPVRMLVNGGSIRIETQIKSFVYYHIELDQHGILLADGLEMESYLDTGNRSSFEGSVQALRPVASMTLDHSRWKTEAAAPLTVDQETVEPIWKRLEARAIQIGTATNATKVTMVHKPDVHLLTERGLQIEPILFDGKIYAFIVPPNSGLVRLVSRAARPSEAIGPYVDDRRQLGLLVGMVGVSCGSSRSVSNLHLTGSTLKGWHAVEGQASARWTDGNAVLPINSLPYKDEPVYLDIEVINIGPFIAFRQAA